MSFSVVINPLCDQHLISPHNFTTPTGIEIMRIEEMIKDEMF